jgi:hypothetical protein
MLVEVVKLILGIAVVVGFVAFMVIWGGGLY